jgi:predicted Zn-dependent protease
MSKVGRNEPCPCGSGKKYKKCCEPSEQQLAADHAKLHQLHNDVDHHVSDMSKIRAAMAALRPIERDKFDELSDRVNDLIDAGQLDEAEPLARQLETDYPEDQMGAECLGAIYEARGLPDVAADHYRRAVAAMDALGDGHFCDCCRSRVVRAVIRVDPTGPAPLPGRDPV